MKDVWQMFDAKVGSWRIDSLNTEERQAITEKSDSPAQLIANIYLREASEEDKNRCFVKENSAHEFLPYLLTSSELPAFVYMVRDPRDMSLSWFNAPVLRGGIARAAKQWIYDQTNFLKAISWLLHRYPVGMLTYESLLANTSEQLENLCRSISLDYSELMLDFYKDSYSAKADSRKTVMWENLSKPVITNNSGKYEDGLSEPQITYIELICGELMDVFGYPRVFTARGETQADRKDFPELSAEVEQEDPWDKPEFLALPEQERAQFENWSRLFDSLNSMPTRFEFQTSKGMSH